MAPLHIVIPGDPDTRTGGFIYDRHLVRELRALGHEVETHALPPGWPAPDAAARRAAADLLDALPDGAAVLIDGLAYGVLPEEAARQSGRLRLIALVHHPLAEETGLTRTARARLARSERAALAHASYVVTTSGFTAETLLDYGVEPGRIGVVPPGVQAAPLAPGSDADGEVVLLCVATLTPRKGHDLLLTALAELADRPWRLHLVGSELRAPRHATGLRRLADRLGVSGRVRFHGELGADALEAVYRGSDLFVLASHYEGYGMAVTEAVARGLPVVATAGGAIAHTLPEGSGLLAPPGEVAGLRDALARVLDDPELRRRLRDGAQAARGRLPSWQESASKLAGLLERLRA